ncbi:MAG: PilZ domain-containing protein [Mariprofundales bacterium]
MSDEKNKAHAALNKRLQAIIGNQHIQAQEALMQGMLHGCDIHACNSALKRLLEKQVAPSRLMMVLLHCQPILFHLLADLNAPRSWLDLSSRFYRLQDSLIAQSVALTTIPEPSLGDLTERPDDKTDFDENAESTTPTPATIAEDPNSAPLLEWLEQQKKVRLFNSFRGVMIQTNCEVYRFDRQACTISVALNYELARVLAADPIAEHAILIANKTGDMGFSLNLIDHHAGFAVFALQKSKRLHLDQRENIDVQVQDLVHVEIHKMLYRFPTATLVDFSSVGIGIVAPKDDRMEIHRGDDLSFRFEIGAVRIRADGQVCGLRDMADRYFLGVELALTRADQSLLQREVFRVQREIIVALNEEGIPDEIADDVR